MTTSQSHPLENTWTLWEIKPYSQSVYYKAIVDVSTVEKFWEAWGNMPKPSDVFGDGSRKVTVGGSEIKSLGLFKKSILPVWEDKPNVDGVQFDIVRNFNADVLDIHWENLVLGLIGETIDEDDNICGGRVVNQLNKRGKQHTYKIEVWFRKKDEEALKRIKTRLADVLSDSDKSKAASKIMIEDIALEKRRH
eukprot:gene2252-2466_t